MSTVLIVDDNPSHLKLYAWILERGGFHCLPVLVQNQMVAIPGEERFDLALLDYRLGNGVSAAETAQQLKALHPSLPIVILSDMLWMPEDVAPYAVAFVRKGEPEQLLETISSAISADGTARRR